MSPLLLSCLSEGEQHPILPTASGVSAGGMGDARGGVRTTGGSTWQQLWIPLGAPRAMPVQLRVSQPRDSPGDGAVLLGGAVAMVAHLRHRCFSVAEGGTPRFLHRRPRCFLSLQL